MTGKRAENSMKIGAYIKPGHYSVVSQHAFTVKCVTFMERDKCL